VFVFYATAGSADTAVIQALFLYCKSRGKLDFIWSAVVYLLLLKADKICCAAVTVKDGNTAPLI